MEIKNDRISCLLCRWRLSASVYLNYRETIRMSRLEIDYTGFFDAYLTYVVEEALWKNELMTWNGDELMTEEIANVFVSAAMEN